MLLKNLKRGGGGGVGFVTLITKFGVGSLQ